MPVINEGCHTQSVSRRSILLAFEDLTERVGGFSACDDMAINSLIAPRAWNPSAAEGL
jgi:hypothetical protein